MPDTDFIKKAQELYASGDTEACLETLLKHVKDQQLYYEILELKRRNKALTRKQNRGLINNADATLELNQISNGILFIIRQIETESTKEAAPGSAGHVSPPGLGERVERTFVVDAKKIVDTGLMITKGSKIQVRATGSGIKFSFDLGGGYTPAGENRIAKPPFPAAGLHEYALVAQVGADWYEVGTGSTFTARNDGRLRFQFNDWKLDDNSGAAEVELVITCK